MEIRKLILDKKRAQKIYTLLKLHYPTAKMILNYGNNWELLVAVMLSAQCTDAMVNKVTSTLFTKFQSLNLKSQSYPPALAFGKSQWRAGNSKFKTITPELQEIINFALIPISELEQDIRSTGFYRNKAKNIQTAARMILDRFNGEIPKTMQEMLEIPGVARKTANIVLGNAYHIYEGIAVDTHARKQSQRFGLTKNTNTDKIEQDLMNLFPKGQWFQLTYLLIEHGRAIRFRKYPYYCEVCRGECKLDDLTI